MTYRKLAWQTPNPAPRGRQCQPGLRSKNVVIVAVFSVEMRRIAKVLKSNVRFRMKQCMSGMPQSAVACKHQILSQLLFHFKLVQKFLDKWVPFNIRVKTALEIGFRYVVAMSMKSLRLDTDLVLDTWFHTALVFRRPQPDIIVSINGMEYREYDTKNYTFAKARGNMVIGKRNTDRDSNYASVSVDELLFWNVDLTQTTIEMLISDTH